PSPMPPLVPYPTLFRSDDLDALRLTAGDRHEFLAAGAPWFFTLFGRDAIWTARFLLPLGTRLPLDTLRVLAARQGGRDDLPSAEDRKSTRLNSSHVKIS